MRLSAGVIILADGTLLRDVTLTVVDGFITDISPGVDIDAVFYSAVTPLFHNGHSHTEYQLLSGILPPGPFFPWVRDVVRMKFCLPKALWALSTYYGVNKLLEMGYASTEDCSDSGFAAFMMFSCGLRGTSYREVSGLVSDIDSIRCESRIDDLHRCLGKLPVGIAPHAVYSTCQAVLDVVVSRAHGLPVCIHVDESPEEDQFCRNNVGPFVEMYRNRNIVHESPHSSAIMHFDRLGLVSQNTLLVHGCNWTPDDIAVVKARESRVSVCPESNQFLQCKRPPVDLMYQSGIPLVIGTDSVLSCPSMSPIKQLLLLMDMESDPNFHKWVFHSQVTPESGHPYDIQVKGGADFCAFGRGQSVSGKTLHDIIRQIAVVNPDVFRSGKRMNYGQFQSRRDDLISVVQELANH
ncbi:MAG: amidohydrolase family protein [Armatimonadota bacterium]